MERLLGRIIPAEGRGKVSFPLEARELSHGGSLIGKWWRCCGLSRDLWSWRWPLPGQGRDLDPASLPGRGGAGKMLREAPTAPAALYRGEGLRFASILLPHVLPKYLLNFISLFPA